MMGDAQGILPSTYISRGEGQHVYAHDEGLDLHRATCRARPEVHIWYYSPSQAEPH